MKQIVLILIGLLCFYGYSQSNKRDTVYLLLDKHDSLIRKQKMTKGYSICYEKKELVKKNRTPIIEGKVWVEDAKYDYYEYDHPCLSFDFHTEGKTINKNDLDKLNILSRKEFLKLNNLLFKYDIFFIEPQNCKDKFLMKEVYPVFYE